MSTTCRPTRPVAPATAILVLRCISVSLEWIAPRSVDTPRHGDVTDQRLTAEFEEQRPHLRAPRSSSARRRDALVACFARGAEEPFGYAEASLRLAAESSPLARPALIV